MDGFLAAGPVQFHLHPILAQKTVMAKFLHPDRLFPSDPAVRGVARNLYETVSGLPIVSPHGHTDPAWFAANKPFGDAASLFLTPDHYVLRMLYSRGISYDALGVPRRDGGPVATPRDAWRLFARNYDLFLGTPSRLWIDHSMHWAFGFDEPLGEHNADVMFDAINEKLADAEFRPLAILDRAKVEVIATTEFALDPLEQGPRGAHALEHVAHGLRRQAGEILRHGDVAELLFRRQEGLDRHRIGHRQRAQKTDCCSCAR